MEAATKDKLDTERLQHVLDRVEISELHDNYTQGADNRDRELFLSVFAPDIRYELDGVGPIVGIENMRRALEDGAFSRATQFVSEAGTHATVSRTLTVNGDEAHGIVQALTVLTGSRDGSPYSAIRGVQYVDKYRRIGGRWRIAQRNHSLRWLIEGICTPLHTR